MLRCETFPLRKLGFLAFSVGYPSNSGPEPTVVGRGKDDPKETLWKEKRGGPERPPSQMGFE